MINDREIILEALMEILEKKQYSHLVMQGVLNKYEFLPKNERAFIQRCCEGTVEQLIKIDYVIDLYAKTKVAKMKPLIRTLLRMGTYQLLFMDSLPDSAVVNESVKLAAKRGFATLRGFVNGILRNVARNKDTITYPKPEEDFALYLSIEYSMPLWIVQMWVGDYGKEKTQEMLEALLTVRPVTIRLRECFSEEENESLLEKMRQAGLTVNKREDLPYAIEIQGMNKIKDIPGFTEGLFVMQDVGSMQVVEMAGIKPGDYVLDVCSAPGGKAIHAADKLKGNGHVQARDLSYEKVSLIEENKKRCHVDLLETKIYDATHLDDTMFETADVLIADLPCSGLGVIGRKSDIKYRITSESIDEIALLQKRILGNVYAYVKKGGTLMYSTCTVSKEENEKNREWFTQNYPFDFVEEKLLLPGVHNTDGFYMAKFIRRQ